MIKSMTGYAMERLILPKGTLVLEMRSVNHRFLEISLNLHELFKPLDSLFRSLIAENLIRGKIDCKITLQNHLISGNERFLLNNELLQKISKLERQVQSILPHSSGFSVDEVLNLHRQLQEGESNVLDCPPALKESITETFRAVLQNLNQARLREGGQIASYLKQRLTTMIVLIENAEQAVPLQLEKFRLKLKQTIENELKEISSDRFTQEILLYSQKMDVSEELSRLKSHVAETNRILDSESIAGKRLDFLLQEFNREANTLASKSLSIELTKVATELKVLIEQMREQVQNIV